MDLDPRVEEESAGGCINWIAKIEDCIEQKLDSYAKIIPSPAEKTKYDTHCFTPMEWKTEFVDHSLQYFVDVWKRFSSNYILPDVSPTALLDCVRIGCLSITWLVPSDLVPQLIKSAEINTEFFYKHRILKVTVGDRCVYEEEKSTSVSITFCTPGLLLLSSH